MSNNCDVGMQIEIPGVKKGADNCGCAVVSMLLEFVAVRVRWRWTVLRTRGFEFGADRSVRTMPDLMDLIFNFLLERMQNKQRFLKVQKTVDYLL